MDKPHDYMEQCPYCKKYLLARQVKNHKCDTLLTDVTEIPVLYFYESTTESGNRLIIAHGFNGVLYHLIESKNPLADEILQRKRTDEDETESGYSLFRALEYPL
jgi:hypothetical protein